MWTTYASGVSCGRSAHAITSRSRLGRLCVHEAEGVLALRCRPELLGSDQSLLKPIRNRLASAAGGSGRADVDGFEVVLHLDNQAIFDATDIEHNPVVRHEAGSDRNLLW